MKLTMLGTGNALVTECYNTCFVLSEGDRHFLVDAGGGNQILKILKDENIPLTGIHDIFLTHEHIDHLMGIIWMIRMIGQSMGKGSYDGVLRVYCHEDLVKVLMTIADLTLNRKVKRYFGEKILFVPVANGETRDIIGCPVTFFDIESTKAKQYGFCLVTPQGKKIGCCGDEPYHECERPYVEGCDWLMHEAFCLYKEADQFRPYEKNHSTVKDACELAQKLGVKNLILYHTEDKNILHRKELYTEEGCRYYSGNLYVPYDREIFEI